MERKEAFYILIEAWHGSKDNGNYPSFDDINEAFDTLKQALERLEVLEKENQKLLVNKNVAQALAIKYKNVIEIYRKISTIDKESTTSYLVRNGMITQQEYELLKEVLGG